jgi:dTMP kinase
MPRGRFIALEGGEGSGKSTQARLLADALRTRGMTVELTREPGGTPGAEAIRLLLLDPPGEGWTVEAEALLFAAARADHVARRIRPALAAGHWVVCDRFVDSSRAYQGGAGRMGDDAIQTLHTIGSGGFRPDLALLITVDAATANERIARRDGDLVDAIGGRGQSYHQAVAENFMAIARADPDGFAIIDGSGSPEAVHARVLDAIAPLLDGT